MGGGRENQSYHQILFPSASSRKLLQQSLPSLLYPAVPYYWVILNRIYQLSFFWSRERVRGKRGKEKRGKEWLSPHPISSSLSLLSFRAKLFERIISTSSFNSLLNPLLLGSRLVKVINDIHITRSNGQISAFVSQVLSINMPPP